MTVRDDEMSGCSASRAGHDPIGGPTNGRATGPRPQIDGRAARWTSTNAADGPEVRPVVARGALFPRPTDAQGRKTPVPGENGGGA
jgi:hypothetical protein